MLENVHAGLMKMIEEAERQIDKEIDNEKEINSKESSPLSYV